MSRQKRERASTTVAQLTRPRTPEAALSFAMDRHAGRAGRINAGIMPERDYMGRMEAYNTQVDLFNSMPKGSERDELEFPSFPAHYNIAVIDAIVHDGLLTAVRSRRATNKPAKWNDNQLGAWESGMTIVDPLKQGLRAHHAHDVRRLVSGRNDNMVSIDNLGTFVVGEIGEDAVPAPLLVNASITGCNLAIHSVGKRLSFADNTAIKNMVGLINSEPMNIVLESGAVQTVGAHQWITWGYLIRNGRKLTPTQVRNLVDSEDSVANVTFEVADPIVGNPVPKKEIISAVKKFMNRADTKNEDGLTDWDRFASRENADQKQTPEECILTNIITQCRVETTGLHPYGITSSQLGMVPFTCFVGESVDSVVECLNFGLNVRVPDAYAETARGLKRKFGETETETEDAPKKRRGRKPKAAAAESESGESTPKRRGRKPKVVEAEVEDSDEDMNEVADEIEADEELVEAL